MISFDNYDQKVTVFKIHQTNVLKNDSLKLLA